MIGSALWEAWYQVEDRRHSHMGGRDVAEMCHSLIKHFLEIVIHCRHLCQVLVIRVRRSSPGNQGRTEAGGET